MNETNYVLKKKCTWWSLIKALIIIAAVAYAGYKIYTKFFKKKKAEVLPETDSDELLSDATVEDLSEEPVAVLEASAEDVLTASEDAAE